MAGEIENSAAKQPVERFSLGDTSADRAAKQFLSETDAVHRMPICETAAIGDGGVRKLSPEIQKNVSISVANAALLRDLAAFNAISSSTRIG